MARKKKMFTLSSERQKEIEKNYVNTKQGKFIFVLMFTNTVVLLIGLLLTIFSTMSEYNNRMVDGNIIKIADKFLIFGGLIVLVCLFYYISYSNKFVSRKKEKSKAKPKKEVKKTKKKVVKK